MIRRYLIAGCVAVGMAVAPVAALAQGIGIDPVARGLALNAVKRGTVTDCSSVATLCLNLQNPLGTTVFSVSKTGAITTTNAFVLTGPAFRITSDIGARFDNAAGSANWGEITSSGLLIDATNGVVAWGGVAAFTKDTGVSRISAAVVGVGNGTQGDVSGTLLTKYVKLGSTTVASLITCNAGAEGSEIVVTDANATTFHTTVAGGGANHVKVVCLNTVWEIGG